MRIIIMLARPPYREGYKLIIKFTLTEVTSQYFGAVTGLLTEPPPGTVGDRPELPQVIEKILTE
jgi:hypothetical protein